MARLLEREGSSHGNNHHTSVRKFTTKFDVDDKHTSQLPPAFSNNNTGARYPTYDNTANTHTRTHTHTYLHTRTRDTAPRGNVLLANRLQQTSKSFPTAHTFVLRTPPFFSTSFLSPPQHTAY